jgi:hypothetical protein
MDDTNWAKKLGVLIADALVDAKIISKSELPRAAEIAAEEILVRLRMKDRPSLKDESHKD